MARRAPCCHLSSPIPFARPASKGRSLEGFADGDEILGDRASEKSYRIRISKRIVIPSKARALGSCPRHQCYCLMADTKILVPLEMTVRGGALLDRSH